MAMAQEPGQTVVVETPLLNEWSILIGIAGVLAGLFLRGVIPALQGDLKRADTNITQELLSQQRDREFMSSLERRFGDASALQQRALQVTEKLVDAVSVFATAAGYTTPAAVADWLEDVQKAGPPGNIAEVNAALDTKAGDDPLTARGGIPAQQTGLPPSDTTPAGG